MKKKKFMMEQSIKGLRGAASAIASAMDDDAISSDQVFNLLSTIADGMESINNKYREKYAMRVDAPG